jgi:hypothetical protein
MTNLYKTPELTYPSHFDPAKFAHPGIVLEMLKQAEILEIGEEVPSLIDVAELDEAEKSTTGNCVEPLTLTHADFAGRSIFPVFKDWNRAKRNE